MDLIHYQELTTSLDRQSGRVQVHHLEFEKFIARPMNEVYRLAKVGENGDLKMQVTALDYRAKLLIERWRKAERSSICSLKPSPDEG